MNWPYQLCLGMLTAFAAFVAGGCRPASQPKMTGGNPDMIGKADPAIRDELAAAIRDSRRMFVLVSTDETPSIGPFELHDDAFKQELAEAIASSTLVYEKWPGRQWFATHLWIEFDLHGDGQQQYFRMIDKDLILFYHDERFQLEIQGAHIMKRLHDLAKEHSKSNVQGPGDAQLPRANDQPHDNDAPRDSQAGRAARASDERLTVRLRPAFACGPRHDLDEDHSARSAHFGLKMPLGSEDSLTIRKIPA